MNPLPLMIVSVTLACILAAYWACWRCATWTRGTLEGALVASLVASCFTLILFADLLESWGSITTHLIPICGMSAVFAAVPGSVAGLLGFGVSHLLFPAGAGRGECDSLGEVERRTGAQVDQTMIATAVVISVLLAGLIGRGWGVRNEAQRDRSRPRFGSEVNQIHLFTRMGLVFGATAGVSLGLALACFQLQHGLRRSAARQPTG